MKRVGIGFVGAGFSASLHAHGLRSVNGIDVHLAAVSSTRKERAEAFAKAHGVASAYEDWHQLLADPAVDMITIATPNASHAEIAIAAAQAGKHIVCEKPMTGSFGKHSDTGAERAARELGTASASVADIREAVENNGVKFFYAENWVYAPAMAKTKRLIETSKGAVFDIRAEESHSGSHAQRSRQRETAGGGALLMMGSHPIGAVLHLKDFESRIRGGNPIRPVSVTAETVALYETEALRSVDHDWLVSDWADVETWASTLIRFSDGSMATILASFAMLGGVRNTFEVYTTNAVYKANMTPNDGLLAYTPDADAFGKEYLHEKLESRTGWISVAPDEDWVRGYPQEMSDFVHAVAEDREPLSGLQLASDVVEIIYSSYLSASEGRRVDLKPA